MECDTEISDLRFDVRKAPVVSDEENEDAEDTSVAEESAVDEPQEKHSQRLQKKTRTHQIGCQFLVNGDQLFKVAKENAVRVVSTVEDVDDGEKSE